MCVCLCTEEKETAVSVFEMHESKLDYKYMAKGAKRGDGARPKEKERGRQRREEGDRLVQLSAHKAAGW